MVVFAEFGHLPFNLFLKLEMCESKSVNYFCARQMTVHIEINEDVL